MTIIPAFCESCGMAFSSGCVAAPGASVRFEGVCSGPCPGCGKMGIIPDGLYQFTNDAIRIITSAKSKNQTQKLIEILNNSRKRNATANDISKSIREEAPTFTPLASLIETIKKDLWSFIAVIIAIITLYQNNSPPQITINNFISNVYRQTIQTQQIKTPQQQTKQCVKPDKIGRNEPCPCKSGLKYKRCCGK